MRVLVKLCGGVSRGCYRLKRAYGIEAIERAIGQQAARRIINSIENHQISIVCVSCQLYVYLTLMMTEFSNHDCSGSIARSDMGMGCWTRLVSAQLLFCPCFILVCFDQFSEVHVGRIEANCKSISGSVSACSGRCQLFIRGDKRLARQRSPSPRVMCQVSQ